MTPFMTLRDPLLGYLGAHQVNEPDSWIIPLLRGFPARWTRWWHYFFDSSSLWPGNPRWRLAAIWDFIPNLLYSHKIPHFWGVRPYGDGLLVAGLFFTDYPPSWEKIPLLRTRGYVILWGNRVAQLVARSTPDQCVVGSSPTCGTEHFGFPPSAPRLGNQRPWYVQPRLCDWAYKRSRATYRKEKGIVSRWSVSS